MSDRWIPNPAPFPPRPPHEWPAWRPRPEPEVKSEAEPDPEQPRKRAAMVLAVIGVALVAALVTFLILLAVRPPARRVTVPPPTTQPSGTTSPSSTIPRPTAPMLTPARVEELTTELVPFVEKTRMLTFTEMPHPVLDDESTFRAAWLEHLNRTKPLMENLSVPFEALGLNPNGTDLVEAQVAFYGNNTVVFYDNATHVLHVRKVQATPYISASLVAALTEQLDDQHFDTGRIDPSKGFGDPYLGLQALVVGDGQRVASKWVVSQPSQVARDVQAEAQWRFTGTNDPRKVPYALGVWLVFPTTSGTPLTASLVTSGSSSGLDAAFQKPPDGSAQAMDLNRYLANVGQASVATPTADAPSTASGTLGALFLEQTLDNVVSKSKVAIAMATYAGDSLNAWKIDGKSCVRLDVSTGADAPASMRSALATWAKKAKGTVKLIDDPSKPGGKLIRLDVCNPSSEDQSTTTTAPTTTVPQGSGPTSSVPPVGVPPV